LFRWLNFYQFRLFATDRDESREISNASAGNWLFINSINVAPGNWCGISRRLKAKACGSGGSVSGSGLKALISTLLWLSSATINRKGNFQSCKCV